MPSTFLLLGDPFLMEGLVSVDECERIRLAVELGEVHLLELGRSIIVVIVGDQRAGTR
jgi:hypothetical protein